MGVAVVGAEGAAFGVQTPYFFRPDMVSAATPSDTDCAGATPLSKNMLLAQNAVDKSI